MSIWKYSAGRMCSLGTGPLPVYKTLIIQVIETAWYYCYSDGEQFISFNLR